MEDKNKLTKVWKREKKNLTIAQINDVNQYSSRKKKKKLVYKLMNAHRKHNVR